MRIFLLPAALSLQLLLALRAGAWAPPAGRVLRSRSHRSATTTMMAAIPEGGKVLCVGTGPVLCLAAKKAALSGYDTSLIGGASYEGYRQLISAPGEEVANLKVLESITGAAGAEFDALLGSIDALIIAIDGDDPIADGLIDIVLPPTTNVKRVVAMSRNLNGKGMGPFVTSSKALANREVWSCSTKDEHARFEAKLKSACAAAGADYVICRAGTLKGGGPGGDDAACAETARTGLTYGFYALGQQDIVNWRLLFDCNMQGVTLTRGDVVEGPGFKGVFAATAADQRPGDTGRHGIAGAMVHALGHGPGDCDFGVGTAEGTAPPTTAEWDKLFASL